jgi:hypothetical protein
VHGGHIVAATRSFPAFAELTPECCATAPPLRGMVNTYSTGSMDAEFEAN